MTPHGGTACRLCGAVTEPFWRSPQNRTYTRCPECGLIQRPEAELPGAAEERARYETHQNSHDNAGYVAYQRRFAEATVLARMQPPAAILDFGCGPGPVLADLLSEQGFEVATYDPFFAPDSTALDRTYDAVCAVEVAEHFHNPRESFEALSHLVKPGGWLFLRTELFDGTREEFSNWWYTNDFTHVAFYGSETLVVIAKLFGFLHAGTLVGTMIAMKRQPDHRSAAP